jgi:hypothetical protein
MKLPSGREASNEALGAITAFLAEMAFAPDGEWVNAKRDLTCILHDDVWIPNGEWLPYKPFDEEDIEAIIKEIEPTASLFFNKLSEQKDLLYTEIIEAKYPIEQTEEDAQ